MHELVFSTVFSGRKMYVMTGTDTERMNSRGIGRSREESGGIGKSRDESGEVNEIKILNNRGMKIIHFLTNLNDT